MESAIVIGSGYGGLGAAIALQRAGLSDITILERADDIGGVWRDNDYPGAACDVPSHLYSYSFHYRAWTSMFPGQAEILDYLHEVADTYGLTRCVEFGADVVAADWSESDTTWTVRTADERTFTADVLIAATGQLANPVTPNVPGRDRFAGPQFHTAEWDHDVDLSGRRVGLVGTGASAIQVGPAIVDDVGELVVFQRSAPYCFPRPEKAFTQAQQDWFRRWPILGRAIRSFWWNVGDWQTATILDQDYRLRPLWTRMFRRRIERSVPDDPGLQDALTPDYAVGCKRILITNDWWPMFARDDVRLVDGGVREVTPDGVVAADGEQVPLDVIVWATGFDVMGFCSRIPIRGRDGQDLHEDVWKGEPSAHLGVTVPGFPNLFLVYGPNTNLGINSIVFMIEQQMAHVQTAVEHARRVQASRIEVRAEVQEAFREEMHRRHRELVWATCESWYVDDDGYSPTNWPGTTREYRDRTAEFDPSQHLVA